MTNTNVITVEDVHRALDKYRKSGRKNPTVYDDGGRCVYTDTHDPDRHCIAGQIAIDLGGKAPLRNSGFRIVHGQTGLAFTEDAVELVAQLQREADQGSGVPRASKVHGAVDRRLPWWKAIAKVAPKRAKAS